MPVAPRPVVINPRMLAAAAAVSTMPGMYGRPPAAAPAPPPIPVPNVPVPFIAGPMAPPVRPMLPIQGNAPGRPSMGGEGPGGQGNPGYLERRTGRVVPERGSAFVPAAPNQPPPNANAPGGELRGGEGPMGTRNPYTGGYSGDVIPRREPVAPPPAEPPAAPVNVSPTGGVWPRNQDPNQPRPAAPSDRLLESDTGQERAYTYRTAPDGTVYIYVPTVGEIVVPPDAGIIPEGQAEGSVVLAPDVVGHLLHAAYLAEMNGGDPERQADLARADDAYSENGPTLEEVGEAAGDIGGAVVEGVEQTVNDPRGTAQSVGEATWDTVKAGGEVVMDFYAWPQEQLYGFIGEGMHQLATTEDPAARKNLWALLVQAISVYMTVNGEDYSPTAFFAFAVNPENQDDIVSWFTTGYDSNGDGQVDFGPGGRAVWEGFAGTRNVGARTITDVTLDPWNVMGVLGGLGGKAVQAGRALREVEAGGEAVPVVRKLLGGLAEGVGRVVQGAALPETAFDYAVDALAKGGRRALGFTDLDEGGVVGKFAPLTPAGRMERDLSDFVDPYNAYRARDAGPRTLDDGAVPTAPPPPSAPTMPTAPANQSPNGASPGPASPPGGPITPAPNGVPPATAPLGAAPGRPRTRYAPGGGRNVPSSRTATTTPAATTTLPSTAAPTSQNVTPVQTPDGYLSWRRDDGWTVIQVMAPAEGRPGSYIIQTPQGRVLGKPYETQDAAWLAVDGYTGPPLPTAPENLPTPEQPPASAAPSPAAPAEPSPTTQPRPTADEAADAIVAEGRPATASEVQRRSGAGYNDAARAADRANAPQEAASAPEPAPTTPEPSPAPEAPTQAQEPAQARIPREAPAPYRQEAVDFVKPRHRARPENAADTRPITRLARERGPEAEAEVHRRIGRERYKAHDDLMGNDNVQQVGKDLDAGRLEMERRVAMREVAPDFDPGEPELTRIRPARTATPPGDPTTASLEEIASWELPAKPGKTPLKVYTDKDLDTMAMQRTMYRGWGTKEASDGRARLYARGVLAKAPPSDEVVARIVDGTYTNPRGGPNAKVPHTNVTVDSLPNMPPARRQRLAEQYRQGQQRAFERYQAVREVRAGIDPTDPMRDTGTVPEQVASAAPVTEPTETVLAQVGNVRIVAREAPGQPFTTVGVERLATTGLDPIRPSWNVQWGREARTADELQAAIAEAQDEARRLASADAPNVPGIPGVEPPPAAAPGAAPDVPLARPPGAMPGELNLGVVSDALGSLGKLLNPTRRVPGRVRRNTGLAADFSTATDTGKPGGRFLTAHESATFGRSDLRFSDGTSWFDRANELAEAGAAKHVADGMDAENAHRLATVQALAALAEQIAKDRKLDKIRDGYLLRLLDGYSAGLRDIIMYNPTRFLDQPLTQGLGNTVTMLVAGKPGAILSPTFKGIRPTGFSGMFARPSSSVDDIVAKHELGDLPRALRGIEPTLDKPKAGKPNAERLPVRRFTEDRLSRALGAGAGKWAGRGTTVVASETVRDLARWTDEVARKAVFADEYRKLVPRAWGDFRQEALAAFKRRNPLLSADPMRAVLDDLSGEWGPSKVYADLMDAFGDEGLATHLSRSWASATGRMRDKAVKETQRLFFTGYERGGFEAAARRLFLFHYFASRQTGLYFSQALRNPGLMNAYINAVKGFDRYAEEHDLPDTVRGFVRLWGTGYGLQMFVNPVLLLSTYLTFRDAGGSQENQGWLTFLKDTVFLNPLIEAAAEYLGGWDDGFLSDPTGLRPMARLATAAYNMAVAHGLIPGDIAFSDPIGQMEQKARAWFTGWVPGATHRPEEDAGAVNQDKFFNLIVADAMEDGHTFEEATEIATQAMLEGPGNSRYDDAAKEYAKAGMLQEGVRLAGPWGVQTRVGVRDQTMVARDTAQGERPQDPDVVYPGTTTPVAPGDTPQNQQLGEARGQATATEEGRALEVQVDGAENVGTQAGRDALNTWTDIRYGDTTEVVTIGGVQYSPGQLGMLTDDMREGLANQWAIERGYMDDIEAQRTADATYKAANPEYAEYTEWRGEVYDHEDGVVGWWEQEAAGNPAAATYLAEAREGNPSESQLVGRLTSPGAYLAVQGTEASLYQDPLPEAQPTGQQPAQQPYEPQDPAQAIEDEVNLYRAEAAAAAVTLIAGGFNPWVFEYGSDEEQAAARAYLASVGLSVPTLSSDTKAYIKWANAQPTGADTSIESFLRWQTSAEAAGAGVTAPLYLDILAQGGDPLTGFTQDQIAMMMAGMGPGLSLEGDTSGYGIYGFPSTGTRLARPSFQVGPTGQMFGGVFGTRLPR